MTKRITDGAEAAEPQLRPRYPGVATFFRDAAARWSWRA